jgi:hypothetical protein
MDGRDLFLEQHAAMHSVAVGGNKMSASERAFAGLTAFKPQDWEGQVTTDAVERAAATGAFGVRRDVLTKAFPGRPHTAVLSGIALFHSAGHMGEAATVRTAGGFGTGV